MSDGLINAACPVCKGTTFTMQCDEAMANKHGGKMALSMVRSLTCFNCGEEFREKWPKRVPITGKRTSPNGP